MNELLLSYGLPGVIISVMAGAMGKVYRDNRILTRKNEDISQGRVDDLKELITARANKDAEMSQMIKLIYDKLEKQS